MFKAASVIIKTASVIIRAASVISKMLLCKLCANFGLNELLNKVFTIS